MKLPVNYNELDWRTGEKAKVREAYITKQRGMCYHCGESLQNNPPEHITNKPIVWDAFPPGFLNSPIHLQHDHDTGMTEGAVHAYCNAVLWQYHGK